MRNEFDNPIFSIKKPKEMNNGIPCCHKKPINLKV